MGLDAGAPRYRGPWLWLGVLLLAALFVTWAIASTVQERLIENQRAFDTAQTGRLHRLVHNLEDYFEAAQQLADAGGTTLEGIRSDRALAQRLLLALARARWNTAIYGIGAYYEPHAFDPRYTAFAMYDSVGSRGSGIVQAVRTSTVTNARGAYRTQHWYRLAASTGGRIFSVGPVRRGGQKFITTVRAIFDGRTVIGVVAVDALASSFTTKLLQPVAPGDVAYITGENGKRRLGTGELSGDPRSVLNIWEPIPYTKAAHLHLATDITALRRDRRTILSQAIALIATIWVLASILAVSLIRGSRARWRASELERARERLENEVAVSRTIEAELRKAAYTDSLTGLPNRSSFLERAQQAIDQTQRDESRFAVFFVDLDRFNIVNNTLGHLAGDELLKQMATRLRDALPPDAFLARLSGDEFVVLAPLEDCDAGTIAERMLAALRAPMLVGGRAIYTNASIGIVDVDRSHNLPDELLRDSDIAMYDAKRRGRARYSQFDAQMRSQVAFEAQLENDLRRGVERGEFTAHYQPVIALDSGAVASFEALARWWRSADELVVAGEFIGFAETHGLVSAIDACVREAVCADMPVLLERFPNATIAMNISTVDLNASGLAEELEASLREHSARPERFKLEITETAIMTSADRARATLLRLSAIGVQIVLDDFGAGYSSLAYLHRLPIVGLKIDRSFVAPLTRDPQAATIIRSIVALAQSLNLYTVAEGVETAEQVQMLRRLGVDQGQGYFFSRPVPASEIVAFVADRSAM